jgi:cob(I)alamin adenosyltransferase
LKEKLLIPGKNLIRTRLALAARSAEFSGVTIHTRVQSKIRQELADFRSAGQLNGCLHMALLMADIRRGLIIVNTGPGKGKTTAAMGTALRAVGQGMRVLMLQFLKGSWHYGELDAVQAFGDKFVMKQMGRGFVKVGTEKPDPEDVRMVEEAWAEAEQAIQSGAWDLVVLDEINYAISYGMLDAAKVAEALKKRPEMVHVILTGRNAHPTIVELADTVTEMRQIKHAYEKGVMAQRGIEY